MSRRLTIDIPASYFLRFTDIDVDSWSWGHVCFIDPCKSIPDALPFMLRAQEHETPVFALCGPSAGNAKYYGHHGLFELAFALVASGMLPENALVATVLETSKDAGELLDVLLSNGARLVMPWKPEPDAWESMYQNVVELDTKASPPQVRFLPNAELTDKGRARLAGGLASRLVAGARKTFTFHNGRPLVMDLEERDVDVFNALTLGKLDSELADISTEPIDGFGANHLAMADWSEYPLLEGSFLARKDSLQTVGNDIGRLWSGYCEKSEELMFDGCLHTPEGLMSLAGEIGIEPILNAYLCGIAVDDIVA